MSEEVGRELKASELKAGEIVVISPPGWPGIQITVWVREVRDNLVVFYAGKAMTHIINVVSNDGSIVDDQGREVRVYEYLGEE